MMKKTIVFTAILLISCLLTSCVSFLGTEYLPVKGFGDNKYIDYKGVRYYCIPEESNKSGFWAPKSDSENSTTFIGFSKEKFYEWTVVTRFYLHDNGEGTAYIHGSPYYYFPEGINGFPPVEAEFVDALIVGDAEISDRQVIDDFMALQDEEGGPFLRHSDLEHFYDGSKYENIILYNREYNLKRVYIVGYDTGGSCWVPVFKQPGFPYKKIPDELYTRIVYLAENS